jgi:hypothetical protein
MFELKRLSAEGIPRAIEKAERYRLLNEPSDAESICQDILEVDAAHQRALVILLLARTDQFPHPRGAMGVSVASAREVLPRLTSPYERAYYAGIICERWAKALRVRGVPGGGATAYQWLREAMEHYEEAERVRPAGNDDALLRWNACARLITKHPDLKPAPDERAEAMLE